MPEESCIKVKIVKIDKYGNCHPEIAKALRNNEIILCNMWTIDKIHGPYRGWVIDYVDLAFFQYKCVLVHSPGKIKYFPIAEPIND